MRLVLTILSNLWRLFWLCVTAPMRLFARSSRPQFIRFKLEGDPPYRLAPRRRFAWRRRPDPSAVGSLETFQRQLRIVARVPSVRGVLLQVEGLAMPAAKREAIRAMLDEVRRAGKQVIGFAVSPSNPEYELLCCTDRIVLPPAGRIDLTGYAAEVSTLGAGLKRLGVSAHFVRRGEYKTAPEMFTREDVSEIQRRSVEGFLDERFADLVGIIARGRKLTAEEARRRVDAGPYTARRAKAEGLCDDLSAEIDLPKLLTGDQSLDDDDGDSVGPFAALAAGMVWPPVRWRPLRRRRQLAVVPLHGMIVPGDGAGVPGGPTLAGAASTIRALRAAAKNRRAAGILLFVNSPGGSALASELILDEVKRAAKKKPLIAFFDRVAASGGYMAALGAKEIWATPHAIAGSIGVFAGKFDASGLLAKLGIQRTIIARGENAAMLSASRGFTDHERASLEAEVEETYQDFHGHVAAARNRTTEEIHALAEGRVYSGTRAKEVGLVDRIAGFDAACRRSFELAGRPLGADEEFDVALYTSSARRFPLLGLLRSFARWEVYALETVDFWSNLTA